MERTGSNQKGDELMEAVDLVSQILHQAIDDKNFHFSLPDGEEVETILKAWIVIMKELNELN